MSQFVYPTLPGLTFPVMRSPIWKTTVNQSASGREFRARLATYPRYKYTLKYEFLRDTAAANELKTLAGFFNRVNGDFDTWLFSDPDDSSVTAQAFGTGDGITAAFQLIRTQGGFAHPIADLNGTPQIFKNANDWRGNERQYSTARTNLTLYSQQCDNAVWTKQRVTASADVGAAPDGTITAEKIVDDTTASATHYVYQSIACTAGLTYTKSQFVKAVERTKVALRTYTTNGTFVGVDVLFDLVAGTATPTAGTPVAYGIQPYSSGWYRIYLAATAQATAVGNIALQLTDSSGNEAYTGDGASGVLVWGDQFEVGSAPTPYIPTTTAAVTQTDCTISATGAVAFTVPPPSGAALTWTGSYYWRCRFTTPQVDFEKFMSQLWQVGKVEFVTVKP